MPGPEAPAWEVLVGDARERLADVATASVQTVVTSPPYFGLRDYGTGEWEGGDPEHAHEVVSTGKGAAPRSGKQSVGHVVSAPHRGGDGARRCSCGATMVDRQIGLEPTPDDYVAELVALFREVRRVLRDDGTVWLNLGDSYASQPPGIKTAARYKASGLSSPPLRGGVLASETADKLDTSRLPGIKQKDLLGIPWMVAFALRADGWYLRQEVIWAKTAPMPESVRDRCTRAHETVFMLSKSPRYFYDAEAIAEPSVAERPSGNGFERPERIGRRETRTSDGWTRGEQGSSSARAGADGQPDRDNPGGGVGDPAAPTRNRRDVWTLGPEPTPEAHFATMPTELARLCILAGSPGKACAECGAPWVRVVEVARPAEQTERVSRLAQIQHERTGGVKSGGSNSTTFGTWAGESERTTTGFEPSCGCGAPDGWRDDDGEVIASPVAERAGEDPSLETGRAGMNRPRHPDEGTRPITRWEQRRYAEQLRESPHRAAMATEAGSAFEHYVRTDRAGARPLPPELLASWLERGWLELVEVPEWSPAPTRPALVLDPFTGAGTTGLVAVRHGRAFVGVELKAEYAAIAERRIGGETAPLFAL